MSVALLVEAIVKELPSLDGIDMDTFTLHRFDLETRDVSKEALDVTMTIAEASPFDDHVVVRDNEPRSRLGA